MNEMLVALANEAGFEFRNAEDLKRFEKLFELTVKQCGFYADVFSGLGCPGHRDPTDYKPSDYIKERFNVVDRSSK